jgi:hypothetical protein
LNSILQHLKGADFRHRLETDLKTDSRQAALEFAIIIQTTISSVSLMKILLSQREDGNKCSHVIEYACHDELLLAELSQVATLTADNNATLFDLTLGLQHLRDRIDAHLGQIISHERT